MEWGIVTYLTTLMTDSEHFSMKKNKKIPGEYLILVKFSRDNFYFKIKKIFFPETFPFLKEFTETSTIYEYYSIYQILKEGSRLMRFFLFKMKKFEDGHEDIIDISLIMQQTCLCCFAQASVYLLKNSRTQIEALLYANPSNNLIPASDYRVFLRYH